MTNNKIARFALCLLGLLSLLVPSGLALATGGDGGYEQEAGGYHFMLNFEKHPQTGPNEVSLKITAPDGSPVGGAAVEVSPVQVMDDHVETEADAHGEAQEQSEPEEGNAGMEEMHEEPGEGNEAGHSKEGMTGEDHSANEGAPANHSEPDAGGHEETSGHGEEKSILLKASKEVGLYTGNVSFTEAGNWSLSVRVNAEDGAGEQTVIFPVDVVDAGPPWGVLSGFFGINLAVVTVAGVLKRKSAFTIINKNGRAK